MPAVKVTPSGIMDKDTDVSYISGGNYTDANDIRHRQTDGGNFNGVMPIKGNTLKNTIGGYASGQKKYRFYIDITDIVLGEISSHSANLFITDGTPTIYGGGCNYASTTTASTVTIIQNFITAAVSPLTGITFSVAPVGGYVGNTAVFDMFWTGKDFTLNIENLDGTYADIYLIEEYLTASGSFNIVGSEQIDDDLFLFLASEAMNGSQSLVSEIGVLYSTNNDSTFTYTRLIRSKKLGFSKNKKIEVQSEKTIDQISFYLTDDLNKPRSIYLKYANKRTADGLLFPQGGRYELDNIDAETALFFPAPSCYFDNIEVLDGAGSLKAGNKRYTGRFLTEDLVSGDFFYPTNPINIFNADLNKPHLITGNTSNTITTKAVRLTLKNIPVNIYKYFELVAIEYAGESFTTKIVQRFNIPLNTTELTLEHTDRGQENIQLGPNELVAITQKYTAAKTIRIFDNRMTMSNLVEQTDLDLSAWAQTFKHQIKRKQIPFVGYLDNLQAQNISFNLNEYINPQNVLENTSYMYNDTYRFGVQVQWKNTGKWSSPYWVDDIRIDASTSNVIGGTTRRLAPTFTDANITESFANGNDVYVYYVEFSNIDLNIIGTGTNSSIKNLFSSFRFVRAERIPEVISTGLFFMGASFASVNPEIVPFLITINNAAQPHTFPTSIAIGSFSSNQFLTQHDQSDHLFFYSPDYYFNKLGSSYQFLNGDKIKLLGVPGTVTIGSTEVELPVYRSTYLELDGNIGTPTNNGFFDFPITHHAYLDDGQQKKLDGKLIRAGANAYGGGVDTAVEKSCRSVNVFKTATNQNGYAEWSAANRNSKLNGYFYGQLFRDSGGNKKYPINKELTIYQSTGHLYIIPSSYIDNTSTPLTQSVFGGDVFNQKTYMLLRMGQKMSGGFSGGAGHLVSMYSQNVLNTQMFNYEEWDNTETGSGFAFPQYSDRTKLFSTSYTFVIAGVISTGTVINTIGSGLAAYLQQWLAVSNNNTYERSYDFKDGTIVEQGFDTNKTVISDLPSRITWSAKKILNSPIDNYRIFKPIDYVDLDLTFGEISHHEIINNNLYTFQENSVQRQYFREASAVSGTGGTDIVIGSGSILASRGQEITNTGTSKKWSIIKGKTVGGKETAYWYNDRLQKIMRFGEDGTRVISDKGMLSWFLNNGKYTSNNNDPIQGSGIHGIWNDRYLEAIFTIKYNDGISNKAYTLVYDEAKNGFICFHSYYPNLYLSYNNGFFSVNPSATNTVWLHDTGAEASYYGTAVDPTIEMVMNYEPNIIKIFEATQAATEKAPSNTALSHVAFFTTKNHTSFLDVADYDYREDLYYSTIKNHEVTPGVNTADTSRLWGRWLKIRMNLKTSTGGQKLINIISKFRVSPRLYN